MRNDVLVWIADGYRKDRRMNFPRLPVKDDFWVDYLPDDEWCSECSNPVEDCECDPEDDHLAAQPSRETK
jgi:hypothetical protein